MEKEDPELAPIVDEETVCSYCLHKFPPFLILEDGSKEVYGTTCPLCDTINIEEDD